MTFIDIEQLRRQREVLERQAAKYDRLMAALGESVSWLRKQEFEDVEEFRHTLAVQKETLEEQKKELLLLAGSLEQICEKYETAEQNIVDYRE